MSYKKKQEKWIKKHDVKVGDFVKFGKIMDSLDFGSPFDKSIHVITDIFNDNFGIGLDNNYGYRYKSLKKITDLKELVPFYVVYKNSTEKEKIDKILKDNEISYDCYLDRKYEKPELNWSLIFITGNVSYDIYDYENHRKLTYEQLLRFEKTQMLEADDYKDIKNQLKKAKKIIIELEEKMNNLENK